MALNGMRDGQRFIAPSSNRTGPACPRRERNSSKCWKRTAGPSVASSGGTSSGNGYGATAPRRQRSATWYYRDVWPNYRCRGNTHIEVLKRDVEGHCNRLPEGFGSPAELAADLAWVRDVAAGLAASGDHTGMRVIHASGQMTRAYAEPSTGETTGARAIPQVYLVPVEEWDRRALRVCGAQWEHQAQPGIIAKAQSLGWITCQSHHDQ